MNKKHFSTCLSLALLALSTTACVDKEFQLDNVSMEMTLAGETTTLPLGYLEKKTLGEIIESDDLEGLEIDLLTGAYSLSYVGKGEEISIEGTDNHFQVPRTMSTFITEYPSFDLIGEGYLVNDIFLVTPYMDGLPIGEQTIPVVAGIPIVGEQDGILDHALHYEIPDHVKNIEHVYLKHTEGCPGAANRCLFLLNDLNEVNGGGYVNIELIAPEGYELYGPDFELLEDRTFRAYNERIAPGQDRLEYIVYLAGIDNTKPIEGGVLDIPVVMDYHISFEISTIEGDLTLKKIPELHVDADLTYDDADVVLQGVSLIEHNAPVESGMTIEDLPTEVKSVHQVTFAENSPIRLIAEGLEWLDDATADLVVVKAKLPDYLTLHEDQHHGYDATTHMLTTRLDYLRHGIDINLDGLDFGSEGVVPVDGCIELDFAPDIEAYIEDGTQIKLSKLLHVGDVNLTTGIEETELELVCVSGKIDYSYEEQSSFEIGGMEEDLAIEINDPGLSPVICIDFQNPLTMDAYVTATLTPCSKGVSYPENSVTVEEILIESASVVNGQIQNKTACVVLADESHRAEYADEQYTFVACDLSKLFVGRLPDSVEFSLRLTTDDQVTNTLYVADSYNAFYNYRVDVPFVFDSDLDLSYTDVVDNLSEDFESLKDMDVKVGDIFVMADVYNTIPLAFTLDAELLDVNGNPTEARLIIPEQAKQIVGSPDGKSEVKTQIRLGLDLGEDGDLSKLAAVDGIRFSLQAKTASEETAALNAQQYIYLDLKLEINGGVTVDLETL